MQRCEGIVEVVVLVVFTCSFPSLCMVVLAVTVFAAISTEAKRLPLKAHRWNMTVRARMWKC